jgi:hypothetical protein
MSTSINSKATQTNRSRRKQFVLGSSIAIIAGLILVPGSASAFTLDITGFLNFFLPFIDELVLKTNGSSLSQSIDTYLGDFGDQIPISDEGLQALQEVRPQGDEPVYPISELLTAYSTNITGNVPISRDISNQAAIPLETRRLIAEALKMTGDHMNRGGGANVLQQVEDIERIGELIQTADTINTGLITACASSGAAFFAPSVATSICGLINGITAKIASLRGTLESQMAAVELKQRHAIDSQVVVAMAAQLESADALLKLSLYEAGAPSVAIQTAVPSAIGISAAAPATNDGDFSRY